MENGNLTTKMKPSLNKKKVETYIVDDYVHPELDTMTQSEKAAVKL
jgi:hypothetical protein